MELKVGDDGETNRNKYQSDLFWWLTVFIVAILVVGAGFLGLLNRASNNLRRYKIFDVIKFIEYTFCY